MVLRFFSKEQYEANLDMEYVSTLADLESLDKLKFVFHMFVVMVVKTIVY